MAASLRGMLSGLRCVASRIQSLGTRCRVPAVCAGRKLSSMSGPGKQVTLTPTNLTPQIASTRAFTTLRSTAESRPILQAATSLVQDSRTKVTVSYKGTEKHVKAVTNRFYRLDSGLWIRTRAGRKKKLWKKSFRRRVALQQHVFITNTQCRLFDKMVNKSWKTKKYYVDDPYEPYQWRSGLDKFYYKPPKFLP